MSSWWQCEPPWWGYLPPWTVRKGLGAHSWPCCRFLSWAALTQPGSVAVVLGEAEEVLEGLPAVRGGARVAGLGHALRGESDLWNTAEAAGGEGAGTQGLNPPQRTVYSAAVPYCRKCKRLAAAEAAEECEDLPRSSVPGLRQSSHAWT